LPSGSVPGGILLPIPSEPLVVNDLRIPADKLVAALVAASSIALVAWFHQRSRTGVALRAQQPMINKRPWRSASMYLATS
jgi:branched-subunit amino acid ABC-type transport system permease component